MFNSQRWRLQGGTPRKAAHGSIVLRGESRVVRVNVDQLHGEPVQGMATDRLLMRPLSGLVLFSSPGAPVDVLYHISIEFHSTGLVYGKYICLN